MKNELKLAKKIIESELKKRDLKVIKIILFGSRARNNFSEESDYDFLIVIDKDLNFHTKWKIISAIKKKLLENKIPNDIIIKSEKSFKIDKDIVNTISYSAVIEGIEI